MNYDEAMEEGNTVSVDIAIEEISKHGISVLNQHDEDTRDALYGVIDSNPGVLEEICKVRDGQVNTSEVLAWLGY